MSPSIFILLAAFTVLTLTVASFSNSIFTSLFFSSLFSVLMSFVIYFNGFYNLSILTIWCIAGLNHILLVITAFLLNQHHCNGLKGRSLVAPLFYAVILVSIATLLAIYPQNLSLNIQNILPKNHESNSENKYNFMLFLIGSSLCFFQAGAFMLVRKLSVLQKPPKDPA